MVKNEKAFDSFSRSVEKTQKMRCTALRCNAFLLYEKMINIKRQIFPLNCPKLYGQHKKESQGRKY